MGRKIGAPLGGRAVSQRPGHMRELGRRGFAATRAKYGDQFLELVREKGTFSQLREWAVAQLGYSNVGEVFPREEELRAILCGKR